MKKDIGVASLNSIGAYDAMLREYPDVMKVEEMSQALGVSTKTGYKLIREGKVQAIKVGRSYRIPKPHLLAYLRVLDTEKHAEPKKEALP